MTVQDALINLGNGLALSFTAGLVFVMLIQPRRTALNLWFAAFMAALIVWAYFAMARITDDRSPLSERHNFYVMMTGLIAAPILFYLFVLALSRPQNYFEPVLRPLAVILLGVGVVLLWTGSLFDYRDSGGVDLHLSYKALAYVLLAGLAAYGARAWWLLRDRENALQAAPILVTVGALTALIPALLALPAGTLLTTAAAVLVGMALLRWQLFTPLRDMNAQLETVRSELRQSIRDVSTQKARIERLEDELRDASRYKGEFLTNMGHQIRTPLNSIVGYSELMLQRIYGDLNDKQTDRIDKIHRNALSLLTLINDILEMNKLEGGRLALDINDVRIGLMAESMLDTVRPHALDKALDLRMDLDKPLRLIRADELRIRQALLHLLDNAVKFTPEGYVRVGARNVSVHGGRSAEFPLPVIGWLEDRYWIVISIEDTGIGIPPEEQAAIFEEFRQAESAVRSGYEGAGMGLAIAKKLVELHTGRIWVNSQPGEGSTFFVALPALDAFDISDETTEFNVHMIDANAILLLIESDDAAADRIQALLRDQDYYAVRAPDGPGGVARAHEIKPAAILVDMTMPGLAGWDAIQRLKQDPVTADTPIIVISLHNGQPRGFALGASVYLSTPVQRDSFLAALAHVQHKQLDRPVLVVDNDAIDRQIIHQFLTSESIPAAVCEDGQSALDWLRAPDHQPGLVVLDLNMPKVGGFEVLHALRTDPRFAGVPVVLTCAEQLSDADVKMISHQIAGVAARSGPALDDVATCVRRVLGKG